MVWQSDSLFDKSQYIGASVAVALTFEMFGNQCSCDAPVVNKLAKEIHYIQISLQ